MRQEFFLPGEERKDPFPYRGCGLDDIYLLNGYRIDDDPDYGRSVTIRNMDGLHQAIGAHIVLHRKILRPKEIRFLRKQLDLTQKELGALMGQSSQQVARWEKNESAIPGPADRLLRAIYLASLMTDRELQELVSLLKQLDELDETTETPAYFHLGDGWAEADAA